ncbi:MAG: PEGA domain-containing protein [Planctomycetota bacterium]
MRGSGGQGQGTSSAGRLAPFVALSAAGAAALVFAALALAGGPLGPSVGVRSEPERASVFVDGGFRGTTPLALRGLDAGPHALRIEKAGFEPYFGSFDATGGAPDLHVRLEPVATGGIDVRTKPAGADVYLDGEIRGATPVVMAAVPAGVHILRVEKTNCHPRTLTVLVTAGAKLPVRLTLEDRVLEYHYYMIAGEPKKAAKAYSEALRLARGPDVDENSRRKVEQNVRRDQQRGGELGARMGAELDRIMRGRGWSRMH